jgi:hypothetical protein
MPDMTPRLPKSIDVPLELVMLLAEAAVTEARGAAQQGAARRRPRRGETLKPGPDTPLWNALATALSSELKKRGESARLARLLEMPRERVTEMIRQRRRMPDAERTLILLLWLQARRSGGDPGRAPRLAPRPIA